MKKSKMHIAWRLFAAFLLVFVLNMGISLSLSATQRMWIVLEAGSLFLSIVLLTHYKLPSKRDIVLSLGLALAACLGHVLVYRRLLSAGWSFVTTLAAALAMLSTFAKYPKCRMAMLRAQAPASVVVSVAIGIAAGGLLGGINCLLNGGITGQRFQPSLAGLIVALNPAVLEEIALRALFFAFCVHLVQGCIDTRGQQFTCWFMMIVPHVLIHTPDAFVQGGVVGGIVSTLIYIVVFGLPFAALQRKRDVTSAMIAHGVVDMIRFGFFGLP